MGNVTETVPVVELKDVSFSYKLASGTLLRVLDGLSFCVQKGEIISLIGPSGAGKTTILKIVAGLLQPSHGVVRVGASQQSARTGQCGYVPQTYSLFPWLTVRENIEYGVRFVKASDQAITEISSSLLSITGLLDFAEQYPAALSGGMQQRVAIARALAIDPAIILLDEPFAALDLQTRGQVQEYFLDVLQRNAKAVLLVTHDIHEAIYLSDAIIILNERPTSVRRVFRVPLERPRSRASRDSTDLLMVYREVANEIWRDI